MREIYGFFLTILTHENIHKISPFESYEKVNKLSCNSTSKSETFADCEFVKDRLNQRKLVKAVICVSLFTQKIPLESDELYLG